MRRILILLLAMLCLVSCDRVTTDPIKVPVEETEAHLPKYYTFNTSFVYYDSRDPICPSINLNVAEGMYSFVYSGFSSYMPIGDYEITDGKLYLWEDGTKTDAYVFDVTDSGYVFDADSSLAIPTYKVSGYSDERYSPVPDGALFERKRTEENQINIDIYSGSVRRIGDSEVVEMTYDDTVAVAKVIEGKEWSEGPSDCVLDCVINVSGLLLQYHSDCGTLIKVNPSPVSSVEPTSYSLTLDDNDRAALNGILEKYIELGCDIVQ